MDLVFDVGNSRIDGAVFAGEECALRFEFDSRRAWTADEFYLLLAGVVRENNVAASAIARIGMCSVVPAQSAMLIDIAKQHLQITPFVVDAQCAHGLRIVYRDPKQLGADRIANAAGALTRYPRRDLIIVDAGTATTVCAVSQNGVHMGGAILPGIGMAALSLRQNTSSLPLVQLQAAPLPVGLTTVDNIAAGLYFGHLGAIRELVQRTRQSAFTDSDAFVIGTGGAAELFADAGVFDAIDPDLTLFGTRLLLNLSFEPR